MIFNVNGDSRELIARAFKPDTRLEDMPENTADLLEEYLEGHKKDLLHHHYKVTPEEFAEMEKVVQLNNKNQELHSQLTADEQKRYEDWEMTRCMRDAFHMAEKENEFLTGLLAERQD
ncbi:hypothetical protein ACKQTC_06800 [Peptococcus simiae]|uniref:Uncharacterized protein n=1 Tax=Peptococcus simiae TaxID=1643805 RepID=A0ABW9H1W2_9FIRM